MTTPTRPDHAHPCATPTHHDSVADCSLSSLLGTSFLTPTKMAAMTDLSLDTISFSPLYNFATPQRGGTPPHQPPVMMSSNSGNHGNTPNTKHHHDDNQSQNTTYLSIGLLPDMCPIPVPESDQVNRTPSHSHSNIGTGIPELDSGVFSPFSSSLSFSTPLGLKSVSPLIDLPGNVFSTPQSTERTDDTTTNSGAGGGWTPNRKSGSRQLFPFSLSSPSS